MRRFGLKVTAVALALGTGAAWLTGTGDARAVDPAKSCAMAAATANAQSAAPAELGFDPAKLREAIDFQSSRGGLSVQVFRNGCLAGQSRLDPLTQRLPNNLFSSTKGVVSMLVGRAVTLGRMSVDDPIGKHLPTGLGDAAHRAITVRQLLTQSSGLKFSFVSDVNPLSADSVRQQLALPFTHEPGTYFEYAENALTLLGYVVERAVGMDLQDFTQQELFGPIGIPRDRWLWFRDRAGHTLGYAFLFLPSEDFARLGLLMEAEGVWSGRRLINASYIQQATQPSPANPGYGFLFWVNAGDSYVTPSQPARRTINHPLVESAPRDMYAFIGLFDQVIFVVPSLDLVVVRTGLPGNVTLDPQALLTATPSADNYYEFFRRLLLALDDPPAAASGAFAADPPNTKLDVDKLLDPNLLVGSSGVGPGTVLGCTLQGCPAPGGNPILPITSAAEDLVRTAGGFLNHP